MSSLRVLMFGWEFPPFHSGGLGVACRGLADALAQEGTPITFVLPYRQEVANTRARVIFADIPRPHPHVRYYAYTSVGDRNKSGHTLTHSEGLFAEVDAYTVRAADITREECARERYDIIHAHDWLSFPAALAAREVSKLPLVVHIHSTEFDRTGGRMGNPHIREIEAHGLWEADAVIAVSEYTKRTIIEQYGIPPEKISVVWNGVDMKHVTDVRPALAALRAAGNNIVLFVGRITIQKGVEYFLRTAREVLRFHPPTYFVVAGSGDMEGQIITESAQLGIADKVFFTGAVSPEEVARLYAAADVCVMPSVSEPFGLVALESATHGTPVVASKQSGAAEAMCHVLKVDFWDTEEMANQIVSLLRYPSLRRVMAAGAKKEAKVLTWHRAAEECRRIYEKILHSFHFEHGV